MNTRGLRPHSYFSGPKKDQSPLSGTVGT